MFSKELLRINLRDGYIAFGMNGIEDVSVWPKA